MVSVSLSAVSSFPPPVAEVSPAYSVSSLSPGSVLDCNKVVPEIDNNYLIVYISSLVFKHTAILTSGHGSTSCDSSAFRAFSGSKSFE